MNKSLDQVAEDTEEELMLSPEQRKMRLLEWVPVEQRQHIQQEIERLDFIDKRQSVKKKKKRTY